MKPAFVVTPVRLGVLATLVLAAGCTTTSSDGFFGGDKVDYRNAPAKIKPLDVPPDLTQLSRESRYQPQGGVISAAAAGSAPAAAAAATATTAVPAVASTVALTSVGNIRIERDGQQRWLVVPQTPEQLWPLLKAFWEQRGFTLAEENATAGVMETDWTENRAKLPDDIVRNTLGRLLGSVYDTGERDRYRTRVERTAGGSEIYVTHRGIVETVINERREGTTWLSRPSDPQLEAEFLSRLMIALGSPEAPARAAVAATTPASAPLAAASAAPPRAAGAAPAAVPPQATSLTLNEPFDRAWRRVGLALDHSGFTVEDRDRAAGVYYVRYVDPKSAGKDEPGWWSRLFGDTSNPYAALRFRVVVKTNADRSAGDKTEVSIQNSTGKPETGEHAQRIFAFLVKELR